MTLQDQSQAGNASAAGCTVASVPNSCFNQATKGFPTASIRKQILSCDK